METPLRDELRAMELRQLMFSFDPNGPGESERDVITNMCMEVINHLATTLQVHLYVQRIYFTEDVPGIAATWQRELGLIVGTSQNDTTIVGGKTLIWDGDDKHPRYGVIVLSDYIAYTMVQAHLAETEQDKQQWATGRNLFIHELGHVLDGILRTVTLKQQHECTIAHNDWPAIRALLAERLWEEAFCESLVAGFSDYPDAARKGHIDHASKMLNEQCERIHMTLQSLNIGAGEKWDTVVDALSRSLNQLGRAAGHLILIDKHDLQDFTDQIIATRPEQKEAVEMMVVAVKDISDRTSWRTNDFHVLEDGIETFMNSFNLYPRYEEEEQGLYFD